MKTHIQVAAWIYIALGILGLLFALLLGVFAAGAGIVFGDQVAVRVFTVVMLAASAVVLLASIPGIIAGAGLLRYKPWARIVSIILGLLNLPGFPVGTLLGIYTIWVLLDGESIEIFKSPA